MKNNKAKCVRLFRQKMESPDNLTRFSLVDSSFEGKLLYEHLKKKLNRIPSEDEYSIFVDHYIRRVNKIYSSKRC